MKITAAKARNENVIASQPTAKRASMKLWYRAMTLSSERQLSDQIRLIPGRCIHIVFKEPDSRSPGYAH
jgi:hypothetical protein